MCTRLLILYSILCFCSPAEAQEKLRFELFSRKDKVGDVVATRTVSGTTEVYEAHTQMQVRILFRQQLQYRIRSVYREGVLIQSTGSITLNGKSYSSCSAELQNGKYLIRKNKKEHEISAPISYSGAKLYFEEPPAGGMQYSELMGYMNRCRKNRDGSYVITDHSSEREHTYIYRGGTLDQAHIDHPMLSVEVKRKH